ncbi:MAG: bifunctional diaminohydroxyphosphoribosylaminopyrimidine deaminase/5-amino-6-(5-phosphoribosylamino)uracil reductase RibD [Elusimicrobiota bacterium]|nr:bifunctional diaminohydroxyphosphoribosylaminopyrimidine deaminase/5-amino-6-(5-phosphoribosylamino)uracil reductase RibD [Elusimicrobiota bacterium]
MKRSNLTDINYMQLAIELAKKGAGKVSPNPMVGCVIVKNGKILSTGYHRYFGGYHAEIEALKKCLPDGKTGKNPKGATMYVTLEPCCHYNKKTPPCVPQIINSGIKKVIIATKDPNPAVSGKAILQLNKNNVSCKVGILEYEAKKLNESYIKYIKTKTPFVILKMAYSLDGKTKTKTGDSKWISSEKSRETVHQLRSRTDAVLVGINTVLKDNPKLTSHEFGKNPVRVILDTMLKIPFSTNVLNGKSKTIIATSKNSDKTKKEKLKKMGIFIIELPLKKLVPRLSRDNFLDIKKLLVELGKTGISSLLVEGGETTAQSFLREKLVDKIMFFVCPKIINGMKYIKNAEVVKNISVRKIEKDFLFEGYLNV